MSDAIALRINAVDYTGWTSVRIVRSLQQVCDTFTLALSERWDNVNNPPPQIRAGDRCEVYCGDDLVVTGYVDDVLPAYDKERHSISISGRGLAADLVDCGQPGQQWSASRTLLQLAETLGSRFGVPVISKTDVGAAFVRPAIEPGETAFEFLEKLARQRGVRLISDPSGALVIARAGTQRIDDTLELGVNILSASGRFSYRDRFSEYTVVGQTTGSDTWSGEAAAVIQGSATDESVRDVRRHVMVAESAADAAACRERATWQRNTAQGKGEALTYTVSGWRHSDGLWRPNVRAMVRDQWMRIDGEMLISGVQYVMDERGQRTELQVSLPEAFDLVAIPEKTKQVQRWN